ncbi:MAG: hypothetical protein EOM23_11615, partial [Candidatus Moranbacteria bacterium]|nr:hypothetical protein [Candidatus Moranbacteria bacterium]
MVYHKYYQEQLYPLQDQFLTFLNNSGVNDFYLTGGTALSRFYFQHRYSDDLDFFSFNELSDFRAGVTRIVHAAQKKGFVCETQTLSNHFFRFFITANNVSLKIDMVNDGTFHWKDVNSFPLFDSVDNQENILANKITCISRHEVKDIADIWIMAKNSAFDWRYIMD